MDIFVDKRALEYEIFPFSVKLVGGLWRIKGGLSHYSNMYIRPIE